jgi:predicted nucleic acid-binding protein
VETLTKPSVYLKTSVFGNYYDVNSVFHQETRQLFDAIANGQFIGYTSQYVIYELKKLQMKLKITILST